MNTFAVAIIPIMVLILTGYFLKRINFLTDENWAAMERLTYFLLFPALLIGTLGKQNIAGIAWSSMLLIIIGTLLSATLLLILYHLILGSDSDATFTSIFQGGIRFNTYIALAVAQGLFGVEGLAYGSLVAGFMIVLINLLCISTFSIWGEQSLRGVIAFFREIVGNPLIISCVIGWFLSLTEIGLPGVSEDILEILGRAALPFGLLAVGAALRPKMIRGHAWPIAISSITQFGVKPLAAMFFINFTELDGVAAAVIIIAFISPTAPSAYILARQLGGDTQSMASIITFQTLLAFVMMPTLFILFMG